MRLFIVITWGLITSLHLYSQDCKKLDKAKFFQSIKFGEPVPAGLAACTNMENGKYFIYDSLSPACKKKHADLFNFYSVSFGYVRISVNGKLGIYDVNLLTFMNPIDSASLANNKQPEKYNRIYNKMVSLYGKPTSTTDEVDMVMKKIRTVYWECNDVLVEIVVKYGAERKDLNILTVQIKDKNFEMVPQETIR